MLKLEDIQKNAAIAGIEPGQVVRVVTTEPVGTQVRNATSQQNNGERK